MLKSLKKADFVLLLLAVILVIFGIVILGSVSASISQERFENPYYFLNHQLLFGLIPGLFLAFLAFRIRLDYLKKMAPVFLLLNLALLVMVFLPKIGTTAGGASRWLDFGFFSFQPSEFLKLTFILYLAAWLAGRPSHQGLGRGAKQPRAFSQTFLAFLVIISIISLLLIRQPDIGTLGIIIISSLFLYFLANTPLWQTIAVVLTGMGGLAMLIRLAPYRLNRLLVFLNPDTEPMGIGYQIKQALIAVGSGGIGGVGLGMSSQRFGLLPQSITDSVFAIMAEEMGFVGAAILVLLFLAFLWRGFRVGKESEERFSQLAAIGIASWISIQAFVNISSMIRILPLTGVPLPFISYGGSALISELIGVGILLNISKQRS